MSRRPEEWPSRGVSPGCWGLSSTLLPPARDTHLAAGAGLHRVVPQPDSPLGGCEEKAPVRAEGQGGARRRAATGQLRESALAVRKLGCAQDRWPGEPSPERRHPGAAGSPRPPRRGRCGQQGRSREEGGQAANLSPSSPPGPRGPTWRPARRSCLRTWTPAGGQGVRNQSRGPQPSPGSCQPGPGH